MPQGQQYHTHPVRRSQSNGGSYLAELWDSFWNPPHLNCPKCGSEMVEYYDPFFFSPIRALKGRRRVRCTACRFIWRPSVRKRNMWKGFRPFI
jgi:hypothetical protein